MLASLDAKLGERMKESVSATSSVVEEAWEDAMPLLIWSIEEVILIRSIKEVILIWSIENLGSYARGLPSW